MPIHDQPHNSGITSTGNGHGYKTFVSWRSKLECFTLTNLFTLAEANVIKRFTAVSYEFS